jgi:hypothetical protein
MIARCAVCGVRFLVRRSRTYCNRHYWRLRRLGEKAPWELERLAREAEYTKTLISILHGEQPIENGVADLQRKDGLL